MINFEQHNILTAAFSLLIMSGMWVVYRQMHNRVHTYIAAYTSDKKLAIHLLYNIARMLLITMGIIMILAQWGVDVSALLAGLSITGFALSFALKDILSCIVSGAIVILYKPFNDGDYIEILGVKGKVVDIDLKYTTIAGDNAKHLIPNSKLLSEPITIMHK